jgi:RNA polymerase-binding transcription factor DksA
MDEIDVAAERIESFNNDAIRQALAARQAAGPSTGICATCQDAIEPERLAANPYARHCCDCAAEEEELRRRARLCGPG